VLLRKHITRCYRPPSSGRRIPEMRYATL
jgi:hypothetical protein